jgi:hypothetical protein
VVSNFKEYLKILYQLLKLFSIKWDDRMTMVGKPERKEMGLVSTYFKLECRHSPRKAEGKTRQTDVIGIHH